MAKYDIIISSSAEKDLIRLAKSEPKAYVKAMKLIEELEEHPKIGTGKPEVLKGSGGDVYSRRITQRHRLLYQIRDLQVIVEIFSAYGHYEDK